MKKVTSFFKTHTLQSLFCLGAAALLAGVGFFSLTFANREYDTLDAEGGVYTINTEPGLIAFRDFWNSGRYDGEEVTVFIDSDIGCFSAWIPLGTEEHPFNAKLNGGSCEIFYSLDGNLLDEKKNVGFFGVVDNAKINDLNLSCEFTNIEDCDNVGVFFGSGSAQLGNCSVVSCDGLSAQNYVGGIAGNVTGGRFEQVEFGATSVVGNDYVGGIAGYSAAELSNCTNNGDVTGNDYVGGLAGYSKSVIEYGVNYNNVTGNDYVGGIAGYSAAQLSICTNNETVTGGNYVGGIAGYSESMIVSGTNYADISGTKCVGGIAGAAYEGCLDEMTINYGTVTGEINFGDLIGLVIKPTWIDFAAEDYAGGDGLSEKTAFEIENAEQLALMAKEVNEGAHATSYFKLTDDIMLGAHPWTPIGIDDFNFYGNFDGQGHTIYGLNIDTDQDYQGLFGCMSYIEGVADDYESKIQNLNLKSGIVKSTGDYVGSLVGRVYEGIIENITSDVEVYGNHFVGGIVGSIDMSSISFCRYTGYVYGDGGVGGIAGYNFSPMDRCITDCYVSGNENVGSLAGLNIAPIQNCVAKGTVEGAGNILIGGGSRGLTTTCSFYGTAINFELTLWPRQVSARAVAALPIRMCYAFVNNQIITTNDFNTYDWSQYWAIVPGINYNLPVQKELFAVAGIVTNTSDDFVNLFKDFEVAG